MSLVPPRMHTGVGEGIRIEGLRLREYAVLECRNARVLAQGQADTAMVKEKYLKGGGKPPTKSYINKGTMKSCEKLLELRIEDSNLGSRSHAFSINGNVEHLRLTIIPEDGIGTVIFEGRLFSIPELRRKAREQGLAQPWK